jgi:hypothetical protein
MTFNFHVFVFELRIFFLICSCTNLGQVDAGKERFFLKEDPQVECWVDYHKMVATRLVAPVILFWG